jgi:hypothetical protein
MPKNLALYIIKRSTWKSNGPASVTTGGMAIGTGVHGMAMGAGSFARQLSFRGKGSIPTHPYF